MLHYRLLLCDADDTLFDFPAAQRLAFLDTMAGLGQGARAEELLPLFHRLNQALWDELARGETTQAALKVERFTRLAREAALPIDPEEASRAFVAALSLKNPLLPGALEAVRRWSELMPVALVTNGIAEVQQGRLASSPIRPYIAAMLVSETVGHSKPHPQMLLDAMAQFSVPAEHSLMLGDSLLTDIPAAKAAGVEGCWFAPHGRNPEGPAAPDYIARSFQDVTDLLMRQE